MHFGVTHPGVLGDHVVFGLRNNTEGDLLQAHTAHGQLVLGPRRHPKGGFRSKQSVFDTS